LIVLDCDARISNLTPLKNFTTIIFISYGQNVGKQLQALLVFSLLIDSLFPVFRPVRKIAKSNC
jgi:hypothetical protein